MGSILVAQTDLGVTYQYADDFDNDGREDPHDNCVRFYNPDQADGDGDGFGDSCDNCLQTSNPEQSDIDGDEIGDVCDEDMDGDGVLNDSDNCPEITNPGTDSAEQADLDQDGMGDACDDDIDGDGRDNLGDVCPMNATISDPTEDQMAECFPDTDGDGVGDVDDLCPNVFELEQLDTDADGIGDGCDPDIDDDGIPNHRDNCETQPNPGQQDLDRDGMGDGEDGCDPDYCYVVFGDEANCLDLEAPLKVYAPPLLMVTNERFRLPFFVNRENQPLRYQWTVVKAPSGSSATVENSQGTVEESVNHEYVYADEGVASFEPDEPGEYELLISVTTDGEDIVTHEAEAQAEHSATVIAEGDSSGESGGLCAVSWNGGETPAPGWLWLAALAPFVLRRRRRSQR